MPKLHAFSMSASFLIRPAAPHDGPSILATFGHVFRDTRSKDVWQWIYRDNPDGSQSMLCLSGDGDVVAHSGASFHRAVYQGETVKIGQGRDSFSHPKFRSVMRGRAGLFAQTAQSLFMQHGLTDGIAFYYGFPSSRAWRLGSTLLDYREGSNWGRFYYDMRAQWPDYSTHYGTLAATCEFGAAFDRLWHRRENHVQAAVIHDSRFLAWRFPAHLKNSYWVWTFTPHLGKEITGYVIFSRRGHTAMLLDLHLPDKSRPCFDFWRQIADKLRWHGIGRIETWLSLNHPDLTKLHEIGFNPCPLPDDVKLGFRVFDGGPDWALLNQSFCFTMADSDLY